MFSARTDEDGTSSHSNSSIWLSSPYTEPYSNTSDDEEGANIVEDLDQTLSLIGLGSTDRNLKDENCPAFAPSVNESSAVFERHTVDPYSQLHGDLLPPVISSVSPSGYFVEFDAETEKEDGDFGEEPSIWTDTNSLLCQVMSLVKMDDASNFMNKRVRQQTKEGAKQLDKITRIPLSAFWHVFSQVAGIAVFLTNVCVALVDIFLTDTPGHYENLHYKVPTLVMGVIENIVLVLWFLFLPKGDSANEKNTKYQQYTENIFHEVLLYPLIVLSVWGFANDKMYDNPDDFYDWLQIVLISIDAFDLVWTQIMRVVMIHTFVKDVEGFLGTDANIGGNVLLRAFVTTVANFFVFMFMILLLGAQVHDDNYDSDTYGASMNSAFLMIAMMTLPLFNLLMFVIVNAQWLVELLLLLGSRSQTEDVDNIKQTELGTMTTDVAQLAHASDGVKKKLEAVRNVHPFKKFISVVIEPRIAALLLLWQVITFLAIYILFRRLSPYLRLPRIHRAVDICMRSYRY